MLGHGAGLSELTAPSLGGCETQHFIGIKGHQLKRNTMKNKESLQKSLLLDALTIICDLDLTGRVGAITLQGANLNSGMTGPLTPWKSAHTPDRSSNGCWSAKQFQFSECHQEEGYRVRRDSRWVRK